MSLSFISKSIQTQDQDGDFKETAIEGSENDSSSQERQRPLFDQLRSNKEREEEEREEFQRAIMRGTLALDEDDAAYLSELQRQKAEQEERRQQETEREMAAFHAAKMEQEDASSLLDTTQDEKAGNFATVKSSSAENPFRKRVIPTVIRKKRKLDADATDAQSTAALKSGDLSESQAATAVTTNTGSHSGLGGLLAGYESESSDE